MQKANAAEGGGAFAYDGAVGPQAWPGEVYMAIPYSLLHDCNTPQQLHIAMLPNRLISDH